MVGAENIRGHMSLLPMLPDLVESLRPYKQLEHKGHRRDRLQKLSDCCLWYTHRQGPTPWNELGKVIRAAEEAKGVD